MVWEFEGSTSGDTLEVSIETFGQNSVGLGLSLKLLSVILFGFTIDVESCCMWLQRGDT